MSEGYEYYDFIIWNETEDREATPEEINAHVHTGVQEDGSFKVWCSDGFSMVRR